MRRLRPDEAELWGRLKATVRPIRPVALKPTRADAVPLATGGEPRPGTPKVKVAPVSPGPAMRPKVAAKPMRPGTTLDGGWDKRLGRGVVAPDTAIDLHGHTLASAHALLDAGLDRAIRNGDRVLLLVTGKPPRPESERPHARGAIRAAIEDWLAASRHAGRIAAVRGAHPRHGGKGALYIILRRSRER